MGAGMPVVEARARWTRLALARPPQGAPLRAGTQAVLPRIEEGVHLYPWPWVGFAQEGAPWSRPTQPELGMSLARWEGALGASAEERRALRFAALRRRGDAPPWLWAYLVVGGELLEVAARGGEGRAPAGEGDAEIWRDALLALDARRFSLREMAFARARAARSRGDVESAAVWQQRFEALRAVAADPARAEIARFLGL